jgi:hypothetical protein
MTNPIPLDDLQDLQFRKYLESLDYKPQDLERILELRQRAYGSLTLGDER